MSAILDVLFYSIIFWTWKRTCSLNPFPSSGKSTCEGNQYSVLLADKTYRCVNCSVCGPEQYTAFPCSRYTDTVCDICPQNTFYSNDSEDCVPCRKCEDNEYALKSCTPKQDTICKPCYNCGPGHYVSQKCRMRKDAICSPCPKYTFSSKVNARLCRYCMACQADEVIRKHCNEKENTKCKQCDSGYIGDLETNTCMPCSDCSNVNTKSQYDTCFKAYISLNKIFTCDNFTSSSIPLLPSSTTNRSITGTDAHDQVPEKTNLEKTTIALVGVGIFVLTVILVVLIYWLPYKKCGHHCNKERTEREQPIVMEFTGDERNGTDIVTNSPLLSLVRKEFTSQTQSSLTDSNSWTNRSLNSVRGNDKTKKETYDTQSLCLDNKRHTWHDSISSQFSSLANSLICLGHRSKSVSLEEKFKLIETLDTVPKAKWGSFSNETN